MMQWHDYLALALFAAAGVMVARRAYRAMLGTAKPGCGSGCGTCASSSASARQADQLLTIGGPPAGSETR
jgi:hypothetical protein